MKDAAPPFQTLYWQDEKLFLLDQRRLPQEEIYLPCITVEEVAEAIRNMTVRGAPAIGLTAAYGTVLAAKDLALKKVSLSQFAAAMEKSLSLLASTRPTAVNLFWALDRMRQVWHGLSLNEGASLETIYARLLQEALRLHEEDIANNRRLGHLGSALLPQNPRILTHCNAGALATGGYGTALGVIYAAQEAGKKPEVIVDETRPFLQGSRLTAWELGKNHVPLTLICDNMAGFMMREQKVDCIIVGADRIARNGDVANKIGTYSLAVLAKAHDIPFYVAAPTSTFDFKIATGKEIPIEERRSTEVTEWQHLRLAPEGIAVRNPAFDVTPHELITAIICEKGVLRAPYLSSIAKLMDVSR